jgi:hypothetical protein
LKESTNTNDTIKNGRENRLMELVNIMDNEIENKNKKVCDLENEVKNKTEYIGELEEENDTFYNKLKFYETNNVETENKFTDIVSRLGRGLPDSYRKESEQRYKQMKEEMRKQRLEKRK